jgi:hypothetical protein
MKADFERIHDPEKQPLERSGKELLAGRWGIGTQIC